MYTVLRRIRVQPQFLEESIRRVEHGLMPLLRNQPGFVELYVVQIGEGQGMSISIFQTREDAEDGNRKSLEWAKEQIFRLAVGPAEIVGFGEIVLHQKKGAEETRQMP